MCDARMVKAYIPGRGRCMAIKSGLGLTVPGPSGGRMMHYPSTGEDPFAVYDIDGSGIFDDIGKLFKSKGFKKFSKGARAVLTPVVKAVAKQAIEHAPKLLGKIPYVGPALGPAAEATKGIWQPYAEKYAMKGIDMGNEAAAAHGYGVKGRGGSGEGYAKRFVNTDKYKKANKWFERHGETNKQGGAFKSALMYKGPNDTLGESSYERAERALGRGVAGDGVVEDIALALLKMAGQRGVATAAKAVLNKRGGAIDDVDDDHKRRARLLGMTLE